jgi:tetratricopeptide (TPR) repeat protein
MAGKIFINYRRDDSIGMAGRLHDRLAHTFGRARLFMDVDHIPAGTDFVAHLNSQVAECEVILVVIGPNWLGVKDENGGRRLDDPDDFVAIEIAGALARDIRVIPVLVDGARMPKASELPDSLKPLARRHAVDVRHAHFGHDAEALVARMREVLCDHAAGPGRWRVRAAIGAAAVAVLLLVGWGGFAFFRHTIEREMHLAEIKWEEARNAATAEAKRNSEEAEQQRLAATVKAEQAKAASEADAKRKAVEAERQRLADVKAEQERQAKAASEANAKRKAEEAEQQRLAAVKAEQERQAKAAADRGLAYLKNGDNDRAIADYNEAIRLNPNYALAFANRGIAYHNKGDNDRAIIDYNEAIRLNPNYAPAFNNRGNTYRIRGDHDRAIADYNEAIRLHPQYAVALCYRGRTKLGIKDPGANEDIAKARQLDASVCR